MTERLERKEEEKGSGLLWNTSFRIRLAMNVKATDHRGRVFVIEVQIVVQSRLR